MVETRPLVVGCGRPLFTLVDVGESCWSLVTIRHLRERVNQRPRAR